MKKGQISVELIVILAILLIIFLFFFSAINNRNKFSKSFSEKSAAEEVGLLISTGINDAYLGGHKTNKTLIVPQQLRTGTDFNVTVNGSLRLIDVNYLNRKISFQILTSDIKGSIDKGTNNFINSRGGVEIVS